MKVEDLKVIDVINLPVFSQNMRAQVSSIRADIKGACVPLKRNTVHRLIEKGVFNAEDLKDLYILALNKELDKEEYPSDLRSFIIGLGDYCLHKTVEQLKAKEPQQIMVSDKPVPVVISVDNELELESTLCRYNCKTINELKDKLANEYGATLKLNFEYEDEDN